MSTSLNEKVEDEVPWKKAIYAFGVTDETFSVAATKSGTVSTGYLFGLNLIAYLSWCVCSNWICYWSELTSGIARKHGNRLICDVCWLTCSVYEKECKSSISCITSGIVQ